MDESLLYLAFISRFEISNSFGWNKIWTSEKIESDKLYGEQLESNSWLTETLTKFVFIFSFLIFELISVSRKSSIFNETFVKIKCKLFFWSVEGWSRRIFNLYPIKHLRAGIKRGTALKSCWGASSTCSRNTLHFPSFTAEMNHF